MSDTPRIDACRLTGDAWDVNRLAITAARIERELDEAVIKRDALHIVASALAGKAELEETVLIDLLRRAEEELRAKRWLS